MRAILACLFIWPFRGAAHYNKRNLLIFLRYHAPVM